MPRKPRTRNKMVMDFLDKIGQYPNSSLTRICSYAGITTGKATKEIYGLSKKKGYVKTTNETINHNKYKQITRLRLTPVGFNWLQQNRSKKLK